MIQQVWDTVQNLVYGFFALLPKLALALIVFFVFLFVGNAVRDAIVRLAERREEDGHLGLVLGRLARWAVLAVGVFVSLAVVIPSLDAKSLIGLLGLSSVAIGFAFKDIFQNFLAGLLILLQRPFTIGDQIAVGAYEGTVEEIQTRATTLRTYDGRRVIIPNADVYTQAVTVNTAYQARRSEYDFGIGYDDDLERARKVVLETVSDVEQVLADPAPEVLTVELAGSSVNLRARWWTDSRKASVAHVKDRVISRVKEALVREGVDIPYPTRTILFHDRSRGAAEA